MAVMPRTWRALQGHDTKSVPVRVREFRYGPGISGTLLAIRSVAGRPGRRPEGRIISTTHGSIRERHGSIRAGN